MRIVAGGHPSGVLGDYLHGNKQTQSGMRGSSSSFRQVRQEMEISCPIGVWRMELLIKLETTCCMR